MKSRTGPHSASREAPLQLAAAMLRVIESHPRMADRCSQLESLGAFDEWQLCPGSYHSFLAVMLSEDSIPEDAKLRLLTLARPRPQDARSFVLNHPLLAADMLLAICESDCRDVVKEQRLDVTGLRAADVVLALMREGRRVRDPVIARIRRLAPLPWESEDPQPTLHASSATREAVAA